MSPVGDRTEERGEEKEFRKEKKEAKGHAWSAEQRARRKEKRGERRAEGMEHRVQSEGNTFDRATKTRLSETKKEVRVEKPSTNTGTTDTYATQ